MRPADMSRVGRCKWDGVPRPQRGMISPCAKMGPLISGPAEIGLTCLVPMVSAVEHAPAWVSQDVTGLTRETGDPIAG